MSAANPMDVACHFCGQPSGEPCFSVGEHPVIEPHMQRLKLACGHARGDEETAEARELYAVAVVTKLFGRSTPELLARARKDRSIDGTKAWVRKALEKPAAADAELFGGVA